MTAAPPLPPPDAKDWTWVLREPCPECGFDPAAIDHSDVPGLTRAAVVSFQAALAQPGAAVRPSAEVWSALEYGCHVRDVCRLFDERLRLMLSEHDPVWADWNQDATAVESRYWTQQPATVAAELAVAGERIASAFTAVTDDEWSRPGRRSNGSVFTVDSFSRYFGHDVVHHVHDIGG
jgi:hypothetical protein